MKQILLLAHLILFCMAGNAQTATASPTAAPFAKAMETVLHDYMGNFKSISGEILSKEVETEVYQSTVLLPGAESCTVTRYHSKEDITASWQAKMYSSEAYELAAKKYKELYGKIKSCYLKLKDGSSIFLKGKIEEPSEEKKFNVSSFRLHTTDLRFSELKVELELLYRINEWVININVVNKKNDTLESDEDGL